MEKVTIYVELLGEGTCVWRPVSARILPHGVFEIINDERLDETPQFQTGDRVYAEEKELSSGLVLVAVKRAP